MAPRWSNPSGQAGQRRFRVWPEGSDKYNHAELAANWDAIDAIIGVPEDGSDWPSTTGVGGGLWAEVQSLETSSLPVGTTISWWRPSAVVPVPTGFEICDGRSISEANHDFGAIGTVVLPDMRNRFVIGADPDTAIGTAGVAASHADVNNADGAPGPQGLGGSNTATLTVAQMPAHTHAGSKTGWSALALHWYTTQGQSPAMDGDLDFGPYSASNSTSTGGGGWRTGIHRHVLNGLSYVGASVPHENRPAYVGVLWIMKVKNG
jgi:microcystin-dependent protein